MPIVKAISMGICVRLAYFTRHTLVKHSHMSLTTLTDFCAAPVIFLRQLCKAFKTAAIEDDGSTKMVNMVKASDRLLTTSLHRIGLSG